MAIYDLLSEIKDEREKNGKCTFNGYLEDYLNTLETEEDQEAHAVLSKLLEMDTNLKICVNLRLNINKDAIANQIIRYRDSFKLPQGQIRCPYIVYGVFEDVQRAMILVLGGKEEYILSKAFYYVMSEPENEYEGTRSEIMCMNASKEDSANMEEAVNRFFLKKEKSGIIQRNMDKKIFLNYDEMYETAQHMASDQLVRLKEILEVSTDKEECINNIIAKWFLLKKFSYVQYMMDKDNLNRTHKGNVKKQRQTAKEKCDAIGFVSYSELWKLVKQMEKA